MRLTHFTDYSLRVLIYLASVPERRATIAEIAAAFGVSKNHLMKVVQFLGGIGLLATVRGKGGGLGLARDPGQIGIGDVVRQAEGAALPAECFDKASNTCPITRLCALQAALREASEAFHRVLDGYTLEDLVQNRRSLAKVLFIGKAQPTARSAAHA